MQASAFLDYKCETVIKVISNLPITMPPNARTNAINAFHAQLINQFQGDWRSTFAICGWGSKESQEARFGALLRNLQFNGGSIVDYGCGTGDLFEYLHASNHSFSYTGVDQNESMLSIARGKTGANFSYRIADSMDFGVADYVVSSGIFQFIDVEEPDYYKRLVRDLFGKCRLGLAVNFLSSHRSDSEKANEELYIRPTEIAQLASSLSGRWILDHSYHPGHGDFTVAIFRENVPSEWRRLIGRKQPIHEEVEK